MKYKLFISDYDGTLGVAPENNIDSETLEAINKFIDKGGIFVVCSGRETHSITKILNKCAFKGLVASLQGAKINDIESGETIFAGGLSTEKALEAISAVEYSVPFRNRCPIFTVGDVYALHHQHVRRGVIP